MTELAALTTHDAVVEALGGVSGVQQLTDVESPQAVANWLRRGFPSRLFLVMTAELEQRGFTAPAHFWGIAQPKPVGGTAPAATEIGHTG